MPNRIITICVLFFALVTAYTAGAQNKKNNAIPAAIQKSFKAMYPKAANTDWDTSADVHGAFEADFTIEKDRFTATFDSTGKWLETDMDVEQLPDPITKTIGEQFPDHEIIESVQVQAPGRPNYYLVVLEKSPSERWNVEFSPAGKVLNKEQKSDDTSN